MQDAGTVLDRELTLFEYAASSNPVQAAMLYDRCESLRPYLKRGWLACDFAYDKPCIRGADFVGVLPFSVEGRSHLLLIAPKGCEQNPDLGLLRFLELLAFDDDEIPAEELSGSDGKLASHRFLLFLGAITPTSLGSCVVATSARITALRRTSCAAMSVDGSRWRDAAPGSTGQGTHPAMSLG